MLFRIADTNKLIEINRYDYTTDNEYYEKIMSVKNIKIPKIDDNKVNRIENLLRK